MEHNDCVSSGNRFYVIGLVILQTMYYQRSAGEFPALLCFAVSLLLFCFLPASVLMLHCFFFAEEVPVDRGVRR